jgi:hypothetical protein
MRPVQLGSRLLLHFLGPIEREVRIDDGTSRYKPAVTKAVERSVRAVQTFITTKKVF